MIDRERALARIDEIRSRHEAKRRDRVGVLIEHIEHEVPGATVLQAVYNPHINPRELANGQAKGQGWPGILEEFGLESNENTQDLACAIVDTLGGREAVEEIIKNMENERIILVAHWLQNISDFEIRSTCKLHGVNKLIPGAREALGFHVTSTMLWIAADLCGKVRTLRQVHQAAFDNREAKRKVTEEGLKLIGIA